MSATEIPINRPHFGQLYVWSLMATGVAISLVSLYYLPFENLAWPNPVIYQNFAAGLTGLLTGQTNPDQVLKSMDDAWK